MPGLSGSSSPLILAFKQEVLLSEDGKEAKGVWWYTRVGNHKNIPAREHGGTYQWKRITPVPAAP